MKTLDQRFEVFNRQTGAFQDGSQRSGFNRLGAMHGDDGSARQITGVAHKNVRTVLTRDAESCFLEGVDKALSGNLREHTHAATSTSLKITSSLGIGIPSSRRPMRHNSIASRIFASASSWVSPWLAHPGREGTDTENPPEGSGSIMTRKRRGIITLTSIRHRGSLIKQATAAFLVVLVGTWAPAAQAVPTISGEMRITRDTLLSGGQVREDQPLRVVAVGEPIGGLIAGGGVQLFVGSYTASPVLRGLDITPPRVLDVVPADANHVTASPLRLRGRVTDDRSRPDAIALRVNGEPSALDAEGFFSHDVTLTTGANTITLEATDAAGNVRRQEHLLVLGDGDVGDEQAPQTAPVLVRLGHAKGHPGDQVTVRSSVTVGPGATLGHLSVELLHDPALMTVVSSSPVGEARSDRLRLTMDRVPPLGEGEGFPITVTYALRLKPVDHETTTILAATAATAQDAGGLAVEVGTTSGALVIAPRPTGPQLEMSPAVGTAPLGVQFFIGLPEGLIPIKYEWDVDGLGRFDHVTYEPSLSYVYHAPSDYLATGSYLPLVRVTYLSGHELLTQTLRGTVTVTRSPETPTVTLDTDVRGSEAPLRVRFLARASGPRRIAAYRWDFDGDGVCDLHRADVREVVAAYSEAGAYAPTVEVLDVEGHAARASAPLNVEDNPGLLAPVSSFISTPSEGMVPMSATFQNGHSRVPVVSHEWDYEGDGVVDSLLRGTSTEAPYHDAGLYTPEVRVTADNGVATSSVSSVSVLPQAGIRRPVFDVDVSRVRQGVAQTMTPPLTGALEVQVQDVVHVAVQIAPDSPPVDRLEVEVEGDGSVEYVATRDGETLKT